ncbi:hypothetical protein OG944_39130 (plasmid) [Streptomyces anulatus]|uniref:hypothetical protein n=1 Tax=Streptomyces anulatus TaxID=1892 RepID=UPI002F91A6FC
MSISHQDHTYPEPAAHQNWSSRHHKPRPLTPAQQKQNRDALLRAQHTPRPRHTRNTTTKAAR